MIVLWRIYLMVSLLAPVLVLAQTPTQTEVEVGLGVAFPSLQRGGELLRSQALRQSGLSYYERPDGTRRAVGPYGAPTGWALSTAFYKPIRPVRGLLLGAAVRFALTQSEPAQGGYEEGFFLNYVSVGPALKYYPFSRNRLFLKGEVGLGSVFTKNRYLNGSGQQNFFHQFGIGSSLGAGVGYALRPFANKTRSLDLQLVYQQFNTRVEVNGLGDDAWAFGSLTAALALSF
jgi:hypothetical protein